MPKLTQCHRSVPRHPTTISNKNSPARLKDLHQALIGLPAIEALSLVTKIDSISAQPDQIITRYPQLFQGLGSLSGEYVIRIDDDAKPYAISTPRRVALPLLPKVKAELNRMEQTGVISRVDVPTKWCTGMVIVPKTNGTIRICVDLTRLNSSVQRERHPGRFILTKTLHFSPPSLAPSEGSALIDCYLASLQPPHISRNV